MGGRFPGVEDSNAFLLRDRPQLGIIADERVETAPDFEPAFDRGLEPPTPFVGKLAPRRRDPDEDRRRAATEGHALREIAHDRDVPAEPQYVLNGPAGVTPVEHAHDPFREIPDAAVGGFRGEGIELAVGENQEPVVGTRHRSGRRLGRWMGMRNSSVCRSTADWVATSP